MRVNRSTGTSRSVHGNETVPAGFERTGSAPAQRHAHAGAWRNTGRSGAHAAGQPANGIELGSETRRGCTGMAAQTTGTSRWFGPGAEEVACQGFVGGGGGQRLCDRTVDSRAGSQIDRARIWRSVQHSQRLAHPARTGVLQPTAGGARDPARRSGDQTVAHQALAGAKKSPAETAAPSSSSTNPD
jgi:hypothetical protein